MIGVGNIVAVISTVTIGGPGSLIWLWIVSLLGMLVKYAEIYLGIKYRVRNNENSYDGGPMYYLKEAFGNNYISILVCVLLCIYGAEVSVFLVITDTITESFNCNRFLVIAILLFLVY
jgi:AGCS family alanine or glycine:cation symporter